MRTLKLSKAFTLIEPGPVVLVTTGRPKTQRHDHLLDDGGGFHAARFALTTGAWNHSFQALETRECVLAIPGADLLNVVVGIGTCSGADVDKFVQFHLTPRRAQVVRAPLIGNARRISNASHRHRPAARHRRAGSRRRARGHRTEGTPHPPRGGRRHVRRGRPLAGPPEGHGRQTPARRVKPPIRSPEPRFPAHPMRILCLRVPARPW